MQVWKDRKCKNYGKLQGIQEALAQSHRSPFLLGIRPLPSWIQGRTELFIHFQSSTVGRSYPVLLLNSPHGLPAMASQGEEQLLWSRLLYKEKPSLRQLVQTLAEAARAPPLAEDKQQRALEDLEALDFNLDKLELICLANARDMDEYEEFALSLKTDLDTATRDARLLVERLEKSKLLQEEKIKNEVMAAEVNKLRTQEDLQSELRAVREESRREKEAIHSLERELAQKQQALTSLSQLVEQLAAPASDTPQ